MAVDLLEPVRRVADRGRAALEPVRRAYDDLNPRERRLVGALGVVALALAIVLPFMVVTSSIGELEAENAEIRGALQEVARSRALLEERRAAREATEAKYARRAPPLGSFVEERARNVDLQLREVADEPERTMGDFTRREVRVSLPPNSELGPVLRLLADIENSEYPVAIERLRIEHFQEGENRFNVQLAVAAYDRNTPAAAPRRAGAPAPRVGPPAP